MGISLIYAIVNILDDKLYVGQAVDKNKRWKNHRIALQHNKHSNRYLQSAYNKYGKDAFIYVVLELVPWHHLLTDREQYWMDRLNVCNREVGYNLEPTAASAFGFKHSEETKLKWSEQRKGQKRSAEFSLVISKSWETRTVSDEARANMSKAHMGHKHSAETKLKMKNKTFTAEQRLKMSEHMKRRWKKKYADMSEVRLIST